MTEHQIIIYGAHWCPDCRRSKKFLGEQFVPFKWVDIEQDKDAEQTILELNNGKRIIPTIVFQDGSFLVEPSNAELGRKLGLTTEPLMEFYDLIIIGGGPTGLTAGIYAAREGAETLVIERSGLGGQAGVTKGIENFPGFPEGISGQEFTDRIVRQARRFDVEILQAVDVVEVMDHEGVKCVQNLERKHYHATAVLVATGATYRRLNVPGEEKYIGAGIHFCATCDGPFYKGADHIVVVGGGNSACEEAVHLTKYARQVTMLVRGEKLTASKILIDKVTSPSSRITIKFHTVVEAYGGNGRLNSVKICDKNTGGLSDLQAEAAFIFIGQKPNSGFLSDTIAKDPWGYIVTGQDFLHGDKDHGDRHSFAFETSLPGVFAAGDVRHGSTKQVASAVGEGAAAALSIRDYLMMA